MASTFLNEKGEEVFIDEDAIETEESVDDDDIIELPSLDDEIPSEEEPTPPEDDKPLELDEKFAKYFEQQTGMPMTEFAETLKEIQVVVRELGAENLKEGIADIKNFRIARAIEEKRSEVDKMWGVDREETERRLREIKPYFDRLSPEDKKLYDNARGADVLWRSLQSSTTKTKTSKGSVNTNGRRIMFTQQQIDAMGADEYRTNADKITYAYTNGLVGE
jgi:hypothetical protein